MLPPAYRSVLVAVLFATLLSAPGLAPSGQAAGSKKRDPAISVRFHAQVTVYDPSFAARVWVGNPPQEITVEKLPSISEHDIASFYPYRAADGSFSAVFKLDRHGEATLELLSTERRGSYLVAVVNGRPVTGLLIDRAIKDGIIFIPSGLSEADIRALGASFSIMGQESGQPKRGSKNASLPPASSDLPAH